MKIRVLSDLHQEFFRTKNFYAEPFFEYKGEDALILAGDICVGAINVRLIIKAFLDKGFPYVIYLPGNHEYYGNSIDQVNREIEALTSDLRDRVLFLDGYRSRKVGDVWFGGGTLWTNFRERPVSKLACRERISDFKAIKNFTVDDCYNLYHKHMDSIRQFYEDHATEKKVIVTHFLPAVECVSPQYRGEAFIINDYFANNMGQWISDLQNTTWVFGHTHDHVEEVIGETKLYANPHGYIGYENQKSFDPFFTIEV